MLSYFWVAVGGALGSVARFWASGAIAHRFGEAFPWGTFVINVTGSAIIGLFAALTGPEGRWLAAPSVRQFVIVGVLGGYTTFSAFSLQTLNLARDGEWLHAGLNILGSVALCLVAVWLGHLLLRDDTIGKAETLEIGARVLRRRGTLVQSGVHGAERWDTSPLYFKELKLTGSNAFGVEEVEGVRKHGIQHYLDLVAAGRIDLSGMLTHTFRLEQWREAFTALATQDRSSAIKVAFDFR